MLKTFALNCSKFVLSTRTRIESISYISFYSPLYYPHEQVPDTIQVEIELYPLKVLYKDVPLLGFKGLFESNFLIPDYLGVGKVVSHGFGTVKIFDDPK